MIERRTRGSGSVLPRSVTGIALICGAMFISSSVAASTSVPTAALSAKAGSSSSRAPGSPSASLESPEAVLERLVVAGLRPTAGVKDCVSRSERASGRSSGPSNSNSKSKSSNSKSNANSTDDPPLQATALDTAVGRVLRCLSQEEVVAFLAASVDRSSARPSSASNAFVAGGSDVPSAECITRRLQIATWPEVNEALRAYVDAMVADFTNETRAVLASRLRSYLTNCSTLQSDRGTVPLRFVNVNDVRVRWNAVVTRHSTQFGPVTNWSDGSIESTKEAVVGSGAVLTLPVRNGSVGVITVVLAPAASTEVAVREALLIVAEVIDGREQAMVVERAVDASSLIRANQAGEVNARIGRTAYSLKVLASPLRVFVTGAPS